MKSRPDISILIPESDLISGCRDTPLHPSHQSWTLETSSIDEQAQLNDLAVCRWTEHIIVVPNTLDYGEILKFVDFSDQILCTEFWGNPALWNMFFYDLSSGA